MQQPYIEPTSKSFRSNKRNPAMYGCRVCRVVSCSATANSTAAPDGNTTADTITAVTATPIIQQQVAGLVSGGQYTFYVWAKVPSGTKQVSMAIVDNAYAGYLAGPTSITLTTAWQRFKITGTAESPYNPRSCNRRPSRSSIEGSAVP